MKKLKAVAQVKQVSMVLMVSLIKNKTKEMFENITKKVLWTSSHKILEKAVCINEKIE